MLQPYSEDIIKLLPKGIMTIPKKWRVKMGFEENGLVRIKADKGRLVLEPVRVLPYPVRTYSDNEIDEFIELDKQESEELRKKKLI